MRRQLSTIEVDRAVTMVRGRPRVEVKNCPTTGTHQRGGFGVVCLETVHPAIGTRLGSQMLGFQRTPPALVDASGRKPAVTTRL